MERQPEKFNVWWVIPFAVFVGLMLLGVILGEPTPVEEGTSYHPASKGYRGCYELLDELGYPVKRSRRLDGGESARWLLSPRLNMNSSYEDRAREARRLLEWVEAGNKLVLATADPAFARELDLSCEARDVPRPQEPHTAVVAGKRLSVKLGSKRVAYFGARDGVWGIVDGQPLVSIVRRGKGEIWLVHYPELFSNEWIGQADNAVVVVRLADATLKKPGGGRGSMSIDEYFHGLRERPGMIELLFKPPILWITLAAVLLLAALLWRNAPRFGPLRVAPAVTRRSKEEFLDAMALLLQRKEDRLDALDSARRSLRRELARHLGMPGDAEPEDVAREAARQRALDEDRLMTWLAGRGLPGGDRPEAFVTALRELESIRNDFFNVRSSA